MVNGLHVKWNVLSSQKKLEGYLSQSKDYKKASNLHFAILATYSGTTHN